MPEPFIFANGQMAHSAKDLAQLCKDFPNDGIRYLLREDLEKWLVYIGDNQTAQYASKARTAAIDDDQKLDSFLSNLQSNSSKTSAIEVENTSVTVKNPEVQNGVVTKKVAEKPNSSPEFVNSESIDIKPSTLPANNIVDRTMSSEPKIKKSNIFHWIADLFRS